MGIFRRMDLPKLGFSIFCALALLICGCAPMLSVTSTDEIKRSEFQATLTSTKPSLQVNDCMKEALRKYRNDRGLASYAAITFRDFQNDHDITLRSEASSFVGGLSPEMLFVLENTGIPSGGTKSTLWVHQRLMGNGGSKGYLDRIVGVVNACI